VATYLAFVAHRDDEINVAGTLARLTDTGHRTVIACLTNGSRGGLADKTEDERKAIAHSEFHASCEVIGAEPLWVDINEQDFPKPETQAEARKRIFRILCEVDPDCLILHPGPPLGQFDYHEHHWIASALPYAESYSASNPNYARPLGLTEMSSIPVVYHMCSIGTPVVPNRYVDISGYLDRKLDAAECYRSQLAFLKEQHNAKFIELHRAQAIVFGSYCSADAAEGFCVSPAWNRLVAEGTLPE